MEWQEGIRTVPKGLKGDRCLELLNPCCVVFFCLPKARAAVGSAGRLPVWPHSSYFHTDLDLRTKQTHHSKTQQISLHLRVPYPHSPAQLLPQIKSSLELLQPQELCFCVSPTRPSNSPFPEDKQLPLDLCHQLPGRSADSQTSPPALLLLRQIWILLLCFKGTKHRARVQSWQPQSCPEGLLLLSHLEQLFLFDK